MREISIRKTIGIFLAAVLFLSAAGVSFAAGDYYNESDEENETLATQQEDEIKQADIQLNWVDAPDWIDETDNLTVGYEIENYGDQTGTESFVDLVINGSFEDTHENITLDPGDTYQDTLIYTGVEGNYSKGENISWSVELWDYGDSISGETSVGAPDIVLQSVSAPEYIKETNNLTVDYNIENVGYSTGKESFVDLYVNNTLIDWDQDIELAPGETHQGALTYTDVESNYELDEMINWSVELWDYGDSMSDQTQVGIPEMTFNWVEAPQWIEETENLTVEYEIENVGNGTAEESFVDLIINNNYVDTHTNIELAPGETYKDTLVYSDIDANYDEGDTISWKVELWDFEGNMTGETHIQILPEEVDYVEITPDSDQVITAGDTIDFNAAAYDEYQNLTDHMLDDKDMNFTWQNTDDMGMFNKTTAGTYEVNASYNGVSSNTITVVVEAAAVDYVEIDPAENQTITTGETINFTAEAYDEYGNLITDDDTDFTWENTDGSGLFDETDIGDYEVKAMYDGVNSPTTIVTVEEEEDSDDGGIPGFTTILLLIAIVTAVAIYHKKR